MVRLVALCRPPEDTATFGRYDVDAHLPSVRSLPGLRRPGITRVTGSPIGEPGDHLMAGMEHDTLDAVDASPGGNAAARDILPDAPELVTLFFGDVRI